MENNPVFFISFGRSGSSITFEAFAAHEELAWVSNYNSKFPKLHFLSCLKRISDNKFFLRYGRKDQYSKFGFINYILPRPVEGYPFWNYQTMLGYGFSRDYLFNKTAEPEARERVRKSIEKILKYSGKKRFTCKMTGPGRISYLRSIFPEAKFIHIIRDGRYAVQSLLRTPRWLERISSLKPWWKNGFPENYDELVKKSVNVPEVLTILQWKFIIESIREEIQSADLNRNYMELKYEDYVSDPHKHLSMMFKFAGLTDSERAHAALENGPEIINMNRKLSFADPVVQEMNAVSRELLTELNYL